MDTSDLLPQWYLLDETYKLNPLITGSKLGCQSISLIYKLNPLIQAENVFHFFLSPIGRSTSAKSVWSLVRKTLDYRVGGKLNRIL